MRMEEKGLTNMEIIRRYGGDILDSQGLQKEKTLVQHGDMSVFDHSLFVTERCVAFAKKWPGRVDMRSLVRGALLHDYFLYDWHDFKIEYLIHGWTHPGLSMRNAIRDFEIGEIEQDVIKHHMFPMTPFLPETTEGWMIVFADKLCAGGETVGDRVNARREAKREGQEYKRPHLLKRDKATVDGQMTKEEGKNANRIRRHGLGIAHTGHGVLRRHRVAV